MPHAHYTRTLARPGTALPHRPPPEGPSALWDSLTGHVAELIPNVSSSPPAAQRAHPGRSVWLKRAGRWAPLSKSSASAGRRLLGRRRSKLLGG